MNNHPNHVPGEDRPQAVSQESKMSAIKTLAIIGFVAAIVLIVWIAVQIVRFIPEGFSDLASIADSLQNKRGDLMVSIDKNIVNSNESFSINWSDLGDEGTYEFSYRCVDGVSGEIRNAEGALSDMACDAWIMLPADVQTTDLIFTSEKRRFTDIHFTIRFTPTDADDAVKERSELVTVVNATIAQSGTNGVAVVPQATTTPSAPATSTPEAPKPQAPAKPVQGGVTTVPVYTTSFPTSNPNGYTDLAVSFIGVGTYNSGSKKFTEKSSLDQDDRAALRFEVRNIGTKTSSGWSYDAELPGGQDYNSSSQASLKPQERAVITILFDLDGVRTGSHDVEVSIDGGNDSKSGNNDFEKSIRVTN